MMTLEKYANVLNGISDIVDRLGCDSRNIPVVFKGKVVPNRLCFHEYNDYVTLCDTHYYYDGREAASGDAMINSNERIDPPASGTSFAEMVSTLSEITAPKDRWGDIEVVMEKPAKIKKKEIRNGYRYLDDHTSRTGGYRRIQSGKVKYSEIMNIKLIADCDGEDHFTIAIS